jgi:ABC-type branched-subunit amino acid transport system substrate-binding protein
VALFLIVGMVATACSRSDSKSGSGDDATTSSSTSDAKSASFGDLTEVCEPGEPTGSPAPGVTPTEVRVATFSDPGFAGRPGLNQEFFDTADVFAAWCNDRGGINGRKIVVDKRDAALTNVKARMTESCDQDFMMVGGGAVFDQDGVETRLQCLLPDISGFVVSIKARGSDLVVQPVPNSVKSIQTGALNYLEKKFPAATEHVGVITGDVATTKAVADQNAEAAKALDWKIVYNDQYPAAGVTDWTPYAQKVKDAGVKGLIWVGEPENLAAFMKALKNIGYHLDFVRTDANHYDQKLIDVAGDALADDNVYVQSGFYPFEKANASNATGEYLKAFEDYKPDGKSRTNLGLQAWSSWLLFAESAKTCGNDLTRTCVFEAAQKVRGWTGGGLHAKTDPGSGESGACYTLEQATPSGFKLVTDLKPNDSIYNCDPKNVYTLQGDYGTGLTLADVGQSMANLK